MDYIVRKAKLDVLKIIKGIINSGGTAEQIHELLEEVSNEIDEMKQKYDTTTEHSHWNISADGYYPYCDNCGYEPDWESMHIRTAQHPGWTPERCAGCFAYMEPLFEEEEVV